MYRLRGNFVSFVVFSFYGTDHTFLCLCSVELNRSDVNVLVFRSTKYMVIMLWCFFSSPSFHTRSIGIVFRFLILFLTTTVQSSYPRSQCTQCSLALSLSLCVVVFSALTTADQISLVYAFN